MSRKRRPSPFPDALREIRELLDDFEETRDALSLREQIMLLGEIHHLVLTLGVSVAHEFGGSATSGMDRIQWYMEQLLGQVVRGDELAVVSGISEYARRVRELRVEEGHALYTGSGQHQLPADLPFTLKPDDYIYTSSEPDLAAAERWRSLNAIRRLDCGFQKKALELLKSRLRQVVTIAELRYVSNDKYEPRRVRELRTQHGYMIATRQQGFRDLPPGDYMLLSPEPRNVVEHDRAIPQQVESAVLKRDGGRCRMCGWRPDDWTPADPRIPELHHLIPHEDGGQQTVDNLVTLCCNCHDKVHAGTLVLPRSLADMPIPEAIENQGA
jgi:hypothetical protein